MGLLISPINHSATAQLLCCSTVPALLAVPAVHKLCHFSTVNCSSLFAHFCTLANLHTFYTYTHFCTLAYFCTLFHILDACTFLHTCTFLHICKLFTLAHTFTLRLRIQKYFCGKAITVSLGICKSVMLPTCT